MNLVFLDYLIIIACISAAYAGYRLGFVARLVSWIGMVAGIIIALQIILGVLAGAENYTPIQRLGAVTLIFIAGASLGQVTGLLAGGRLKGIIPQGPFRIIDQTIGAIVGIFGVLLTVWLILPVAANVPGVPAQQVRNSQIAQGIYDHAPAPPDAIQTLRELVGESVFPYVFEGIAPSPDIGPPPVNIAIPPDIIQKVAAASVKVEGSACRRTQDGSGFVIAPGVIATNAHVVAGESKTIVITPRGQTLPATVTLYDSARDIALLRVDDYSQQPLSIAVPNQGDEGAVFGHPRGQDQIAISPSAVRQKIVAAGRDLYNQYPTRRDVLVLAASLRQGDSGGPLVNSNGDVIGMAFAIAPDKQNTAYALNSSELKTALATPHNERVSTGNCLTS